MKRIPAYAIYICICAGMALANLPAAAQGETKKESTNVFSDIGRWLNRSWNSIGDQFRDAGKGLDRGIDNLNREAGVAAKTTASAASNAADAVAKLPKTRVVSGHQNCPVADNGAPDCAAGANKLCQTKGLKSGTSLGVTSARECQLPQRLSQRESGPRECKDVTFVTRAMCQ